MPWHTAGKGLGRLRGILTAAPGDRPKCLDFSMVRGDALEVMAKWSLRKLVVIGLGALLALSMNAPAVQAGNMPAQMTQMIAAPAMGTDPQACDGCATGEAMAVPCLAVCGASLLAVLADIQPVGMHASAGRLRPPGVEPLLGSSSAPAPFPPRTTYIG